MSSRSPWRVGLSVKAQDDFEDLVLSGTIRWGESQGSEYGSAVREAIDPLALFPYLGRDIEEVLPRGRRFVVREHAIYHQIRERAELVVRILHRTQDTEKISRSTGN